MKVITSVKDLKTAAARVLPAVPSKAQTPIQGGILFKAEGGKLELQANDFSTAIKAEIAAEVEVAGSMVVSGKNFAEVVTKLPGNIVTLEETDGTVSIKSDATKFELFTMDAEDFAGFEFTAPDLKTMLPVAILRGLINKTTFACANEKDGRPVFQGVSFYFTPTKITAVATNTHRLAVVTATAELDEITGEKVMIIPAKVLNALERLMPAEGNVNFQATSRNVLFGFEDFAVTTRLVDGNFPPYEKVLNIDVCGTAEVDVGELKSALTRTDIISRASENNTLKMQFDGEGLELSAESYEAGKVIEHLNAEVEGQIKIAFNSTYIGDFARATDSKTIIFEFGENGTTPMKMHGAGEDNFVYVATPVRTQ